MEDDRLALLTSRVVAWLSHRRSAALTYLVSTAVGAGFLLLAGIPTASKTLLGIPGSGVTLFVVVAAVFAGPLVGVAVAASLATVFFAVVADFGAVAEPFGTLIGLLVWLLSGLLAGIIADGLRRALAERDAAEEQSKLYALLEAGLIPGRRFSFPGITAHSRYVPSEQRLRLGGDFFDVRHTSNGAIAFIIGDVAGHGPAAAALSARLRASWQGLLLSGAEPKLILHALNQTVFEGGDEAGPFVTAFLGWLDLGAAKLTYLSAGHPPVLIVGEKVTALSIAGTLPLGIEEDPDPVFAKAEITPPCTLLAYTDGLLESHARRRQDRDGERWLLGELESLGADGVGEPALDRLLEQTLSAGVSDDIAILALAISSEAIGAHERQAGAPLDYAARSLERARPD